MDSSIFYMSKNRRINDFGNGNWFVELERSFGDVLFYMVI